MALINVGKIENFAVAAKKNAKSVNKSFKSIQNFDELTEVSRDVAPNSFELLNSSDKRGVGIKNLRLEKGFDGFISNLFKSTNNIYFIAWAWDMSGKPVNLYPGKDVDVKDVIIPIKAGKLREFIGEGINLFPKQEVTGGISLRIQIWESDEDTRNLGKVLSETAETVEKSKLNNLLTLVALGTGVSGVTIAMVKDAAIELAKLVGAILKSNGEDYVDFFEGHYSADKAWVQGQETYQGNSSSITIEKF